ncbi:MAG: winged helix-turn-helix transcriptional regulator [Paludibacteraceae bacterium]|nr:winged helix-turn-helix transcriptional regulator [Paludibacteraceae bacterium]
MIHNKYYKAGFIESWGRGWQKICDGFTAAGLPKPTIESAQGGVLVTFQRNNVNLLNQNPIDAQNVAGKVTEKVTERQVVILEEIGKNTYITAQQLSDILGISLRKTKENLSKLKERGIIRRVGPDKGGHWEIIKEE